MTALLEKYRDDIPEYTKLTSLLTTEEGRRMWLFELTDIRAGDFSEKPAYWAIGPVHCQEIVGVMAVIHFIDYLLTNKEQPEVADLLAHYTVSLIPMATPDGTDRVLHSAEIPRVVRVMRFRDPYGSWKISEEDPRVMILRKPDELEEEFYMVLNEGEFECENRRDHLYNGPERYPYNMNRNWPYGWLPAVGQKGAGEYPLQAAENRAIADFIASHTNLCFILSFHSSGGVLFYPPVTRLPQTLNRNDNKIMIPHKPCFARTGWVVRAKPDAVLTLHASSDRGGHCRTAIRL
ncbi:MAG: hypothetical protein HFI93_08750 [Lachnospiraceae bacterium]|nr:hypothetical protein [Lachnospiraceae bacterium]